MSKKDRFIYTDNDLLELLAAVRDRAIDVEQGEKPYHHTDSELLCFAWRFLDNHQIPNTRE